MAFIRGRLVKPAVGKAGDISAKVTAVDETQHFTKVTVVVSNKGKFNTVLPLGFCILTADGGLTLTADPLRSDWSDNKPPRITQSGTVTFVGHLPASARLADLSFSVTQVQGPVESGPLTVANIALSGSAAPGGLVGVGSSLVDW